MQYDAKILFNVIKIGWFYFFVFQCFKAYFYN